MPADASCCGGRKVADCVAGLLVRRVEECVYGADAVSKLTNCQIRALLPGMEGTAEKYEREGKRSQARRVRRRLEAYRAELAGREAAGAEPGTEIQTVRHGEAN